MSHTCRACFQASEKVINACNSTLGDALPNYVQLQKSGHFPKMCEEAPGLFRVCYAANSAGGRQR